MLNILADEDVNFKIVKKLRIEGFKVTSILEEFKGLDDKEILNITKEKQFVLLTEDKDFGEWVFAHHKTDVSVIFLRYKAKDFEAITDSIIKILNKYGDLLLNKFVVITPNKIRIREI